MSSTPSVRTQDNAPADPEREQQAREEYAEQVEAERDAIKGKLDGMRAALGAKNEELKAARAAARKG